MKALFWTNRFYPVIGGVQVVALPLLHALRSRGYHIEVITDHFDETPTEHIEHEGIPIHRFRLRKALESNDMKWVLRERQRVIEFLRKFSPDLIHVFGFGVSEIFHLQTRPHHHAPTLLTLQAEDSNFIRQQGRETILFRMLQQADWVTSVTRIEVERLRKILPSLAANSSCIYNSLQMPQVAPATLPETPMLMTLGRLSPEKSFELAIHAFALVAAQYPQARLHIVGDGDERSKLELLARDLGVTSQVDFVGWVVPPLVPEYINQASAVVLSSQTEGLPLAGIQTAQMARPLIAPAVGGIPELVVDGETGLLSKPNDAADMARSMERVLNSRPFATKLGNAARTHVETHFDFDSIVDQYAELYERLSIRAGTFV